MDAAITTRDNVRCVFIAGDTHGNSAWVERLARTASDQGCPIAIQVGDFGYIPDHPEGLRFLTAVETACARHGVELWFIDGNHDDHSAAGAVNINQSLRDELAGDRRFALRSLGQRNLRHIGDVRVYRLRPGPMGRHPAASSDQ